MGNAHMEIFLYYIYFWSCFPGVYDLTAVMSHCIKVVVRRGKKKFLYQILCTDAVCGNTNKGAVWLMLWNLAHRMYLLLKTLENKMICYYFICGNKMREKNLLVLSTCIKFFSNLHNDGLGRDKCFSVSEVLMQRYLNFLLAWLWTWSLVRLVFCPLLLYLVDNLLAQVGSKLGLILQALQTSLIPLSIFNLLSN